MWATPVASASWSGGSTWAELEEALRRSALRHGYPGDRRRAFVVPRPHRRIQQGIPAGLAGDGGLAAAVAAGFHRAGGKTALGKGGKGAVEVHGVIASSRSVHSKEDWLLHLVTGQSAPRWRMPLLFTRWHRAAGK